ncbi:MAG: SufE family protein [Bacteroidia bacterium]|nr:SufE family protein [Bacteroidia bacterium]
MSIEAKKQALIEDFALFDDWEGKYEYIIDLGKNLPLISPNLKTDDKLVKGCQSRVWIDASYSNGLVFFTADSDAIITKGIIALLISVFNGESPQTIALSNTDFIDQIGLKEHLSPTRSNGLVSMINLMKSFALKHC